MADSIEFDPNNPFASSPPSHESTMQLLSSFNSLSSSLPPITDFATSTFFDRDYDTLVSEIESGHATCATIIRKIREPYSSVKNASALAALNNKFSESTITSSTNNSSDESSLLPLLLQRLNLRAEDHKKAIEVMCRQQYQGFAESIHELVRVKDEVSQLKVQLAATASNVDQSTAQILTAAEKYEKCQDALRNTRMAIESLQMCLPILDQYSRVKRNIADNRFFPALKSLRSLEHSQLPLIENYDFSKSLAAQIPSIRELIKTKSQSQHTDFLESVRRHSVRLGAIAMTQTAQKMGMKLSGILSDSPQELEMKRRNQPVNPFTGEIQNMDTLEKEWENLIENIMKPKSNNAACGGGANEGDLPIDEDSNIEDLVDFGPVYRCLHIHTVLGERSSFEKTYRYDRKKQWQLCVKMSEIQQNNLKNYNEFFSSIVGFFVVEDYIYHTVPTMVSKAYLDELWSDTIQNVIKILQRNVKGVNETYILLRLKDVCIVFTRTMLFLGFNITGFKEVFDVIRQRYNVLLAEEWKKRFEEIFDGDDYSAIYLATGNDYQQIIDMYPCQSPEFDILPFPKRLTFSMMVPRIFLAIQEYINLCSQFAENLDLSQTEREDMVHKATNTLFSDSLNECMSIAVKRIHNNLLQLIQLSLNMEELKISCSKLEKYIQVMIYGSPIHSDQPTTGAIAVGSRPRLHGVLIFGNTQSEAELQIFGAINVKIDSFFTLANYDWMQEERNAGVRKEASSYITDLMSYLNGTFRAFTNLPPKMAQMACILSCKYIAEKMRQLILNNDVRMISESALQQVSLDLGECEKFALDEPVAGVDSATLSSTFLDLRQLLDLVLKENWDIFIKSYAQPSSPYNRVSLSHVIKLLEKVKEGDKKRTTIFSVGSKAGREKRRRLEDGLRHLKELQQSANKS